MMLNIMRAIWVMVTTSVSKRTIFSSLLIIAAIFLLWVAASPLITQAFHLSTVTMTPDLSISFSTEIPSLVQTQDAKNYATADAARIATETQRARTAVP